MNEIKRIYEDEDIIVINKPGGVTSEDGKTPGLPSLLAENGKRPFVVHRLDREVGGLMVLAKKESAAARLSSQLQSGGFGKEYLAVVEGETESMGRYEDLLFHDRNRNKTYVVDRERAGVKKAVLSYARLSTADLDGMTLSLVKVKLETGRTHQIRVQFATRRHPIFGDRRYGSKCTGNFALFSSKLSFIHPVSGEVLRFSAEPEKTEPWSLFRNK